MALILFLKTVSPIDPKKMRAGLTYGVNRRYRSGAVVGDEKSEGLVGKVTRRGSVRVERLVRWRGREIGPGFFEIAYRVLWEKFV